MYLFGKNYFSDSFLNQAYRINLTSFDMDIVKFELVGEYDWFDSINESEHLLRRTGGQGDCKPKAYYQYNETSIKQLPFTSIRYFLMNSKVKKEMLKN